MNMHILAFILATLPLALTAQAAEMSMDASGMHPGSASSAHASGPRAGCETARTLSEEEGDVAVSKNNVRRTATRTSTAGMQVSDQATEGSDTDSAIGSSATGKSLAVPLKPRSTRWQSLVPGAIK